MISRLECHHGGQGSVRPVRLGQLAPYRSSSDLLHSQARLSTTQFLHISSMEGLSLWWTNMKVPCLLDVGQRGIELLAIAWPEKQGILDDTVPHVPAFKLQQRRLQRKGRGTDDFLDGVGEAEHGVG